MSSQIDVSPAVSEAALALAVDAVAGEVVPPLRPRGDLENALEGVADELWREAACLGDRLDASGELTAGLGLVPGGAALADRIGLRDGVGVETRLRARSAPPTAIGFERLARASGV